MLSELDLTIRAVCPIDGVDSSGTVWFAADATPEQQAAALEIASQWDATDWRANSQIGIQRARERAIEQIKLQCRKDILEQWPEWKQANMTARALELVSIKSSGGVLSESEQQEESEILEAWEWIKQRRAQSDAEEALITG